MIQKEVFSERLKAAMNKQNVKQIDLVRAAQSQGIKLGKSHISQYVSGKTVPRTDILLFLAKTLQVEEEWLIGVSDMESDTAISASKNRDLLDKNDASNNIQTTSVEIISRDISNKVETTIFLVTIFTFALYCVASIKTIDPTGIAFVIIVILA